MAGTGSSRGIISGINVTPLVDVTLVLLVIFIVTAKIVVTPAIPMDLPPAATSESVQVVFSVLLPEDGGILANGTPVANEGALAARARAALEEDPDLRAVISADGGVPHRVVMATLDALKQGGVTRIAFGTLPAAAAKANPAAAAQVKPQPAAPTKPAPATEGARP